MLVLISQNYCRTFFTCSCFNFANEYTFSCIVYFVIGRIQNRSKQKLPTRGWNKGRANIFSFTVHCMWIALIAWTLNRLKDFPACQWYNIHVSITMYCFRITVQSTNHVVCDNECQCVWNPCYQPSSEGSTKLCQRVSEDALAELYNVKDFLILFIQCTHILGIQYTKLADCQN